MYIFIDTKGFVSKQILDSNKFQKEIKIKVMLMRFSSFLWIINIVKIIIILLNINGYLVTIYHYYKIVGR